MEDDDAKLMDMLLPSNISVPRTPSSQIRESGLSVSNRNVNSGGNSHSHSARGPVPMPPSTSLNAVAAARSVRPPLVDALTIDPQQV